MDIQKIVENIQIICKSRDRTPTEACRESGAGRTMISNMKKGSWPSVEKFQLLAEYLGVTTSELLGEEDPHGEGPAQPYLVMRYNSLPPASQDKLMTFLEYLVAEEGKKNVSESDTQKD